MSGAELDGPARPAIFIHSFVRRSADRHRMRLQYAEGAFGNRRAGGISDNAVAGKWTWDRTG